MDVEPKILVVDDEENLLRSVEKTLFRAGFDVETANGNAEALELFKEAIADQEPFDLVILDLNMPDFEGNESRYAGLELLGRLKQEAPNTPVIINSAWDETETAKTCLDRGADDYFVKGRNEQMLTKVRAALHIAP
jgi:DNA-binding response OmpR family regulator